MAAAAAFVAWCSPRRRRRTRTRWSTPVSHGCAGRTRRRSSSSSSSDSRRTTAPVLRPNVRTRPRVRGAIAATSGSSRFSTAIPSGPSASTISPFACAIAERDPNSPRWAMPTLRTTETSGGAIAQRSAMWPTPRAPISRTRKRVEGSTPRTVSGSPSSLLNDWYVATVGPASESTAASMSLTLVLPCEPVTATTRRSGAARRTRRRTSAARVCRAAWTSGTTTVGTSVGRHPITAAAPPPTAAAAKS